MTGEQTQEAAVIGASLYAGWRCSFDAPCSEASVQRRDACSSCQRYRDGQAALASLEQRIEELTKEVERQVALREGHERWLEIDPEPHHRRRAVVQHFVGACPPGGGNVNEAIELAWGIIANAGGGNWQNESPEWVEAAERWRDRYVILQPTTEAALDRIEAVVKAAREEHAAFMRMPDAMLAKGDPRYDWWAETYPERKAMWDALDDLDSQEEGTP